MLSKTTSVNSITLKYLRIQFLALFLLVSSSAFAVPLIPYEIESIGPTNVSPGEVVSFIIIDPTPQAGGTCLGGTSIEGLKIDAFAKTILVAITVEQVDFSICATTPRQILPAFMLSSFGSYTLKIYDNSPFFDEPPRFEEDRLIKTAQIEVTYPVSGFGPEVPAEGSIQSGVGMLRGWACDATAVEVSFNGGERIPVAYGTSRNDTVTTCGDANNGYGMVINWALLGEGTHRMQTYLNGNAGAHSDVEFEVSGLGVEFAKGLSGTYELQDFPAPGESVAVEWSEPHQNFIIINKQ